MVNITYIGHACFRLDYQGQSLVLDPYADGYVPGLDPVGERVNFVYCSHGHDDHGAADVVELVPGENPCFTVEELLVDHDPEGGRLRGKSLIRIFSFGDIRVAHMGDIGRALSDEEKERLRGLDAMLIPVGGFFTIDAVQARAMVDELRPRVAIPMHYRTDTSGYDVIARVEDFTALCGTVTRWGCAFGLDKDTPAQVALLQQKALSK